MPDLPKARRGHGERQGRPKPLTASRSADSDRGVHRRRPLFTRSACHSVAPSGALPAPDSPPGRRRPSRLPARLTAIAEPIGGAPLFSRSACHSVARPSRPLRCVAPSDSGTPRQALHAGAVGPFRGGVRYSLTGRTCGLHDSRGTVPSPPGSSYGAPAPRSASRCADGGSEPYRRRPPFFRLSPFAGRRRGGLIESASTAVVAPSAAAVAPWIWRRTTRRLLPLTRGAPLFQTQPFRYMRRAGRALPMARKSVVAKPARRANCVAPGVAPWDPCPGIAPSARGDASFSDSRRRAGFPDSPSCGQGAVGSFLARRPFFQATHGKQASGCFRTHLRRTGDGAPFPTLLPRRFGGTFTRATLLRKYSTTFWRRVSSRQPEPEWDDAAPFLNRVRRHAQVSAP